jgi:hypothetical protein
MTEWTFIKNVGYRDVRWIESARIGFINKNVTAYSKKFF